MGLIKKGSFKEKKSFKLADIYEDNIYNLKTQKIKEANNPSVSQQSQDNQRSADQAMYSKSIDSLNEEKQRVRQEIAALKQKSQDELNSMRNAARKEADTLVSQARQQADDIRESARSEGYASGLNEGEGKYLESVKELGQAINTLMQEKEQMFKSAENELVKLSVRMAEQIIRTEITLNPEATISIVTDAIARITDRDKVIIKVSKKDFDFVQKNKDRIRNIIDGIKNLIVQEDDTIEQGGCMIETDLGYVDSRINLKLDAVRSALQKSYNETYEVEQDDIAESASDKTELLPVIEAEEETLEAVENNEEDFFDFDDEDKL